MKTDNLLRLDNFLSSQLNITRSDAKKLIKQNRIDIRGVAPVRPETKIDPSVSEVLFDGERIDYKKHIYIAQNKPEGIVCSTDDSTRTVIDILPEKLKRRGLFPAGRLDKDTTGFVLITDDGEFAHNILSPTRHIEKSYRVTLSRKVKDSEKAEIENGLILDGERLDRARLSHISSNAYELVITQGKYHQIKRMFLHFDNPVLGLHRTKLGSLDLPSDIKPGQSRELTMEELNKITQK